MAPTHVRKRVWQRQQRLRALGFDSYQAYLASATWKAIRSRYRASDLPQACICGADEGLELHHLTYERVGGEERLDDLTPLCETCHRIVHVLERRGEISLDLADMADPGRAAEYRRQALVVAIAGQAKREEFHALSIPERFIRLNRASVAHGGLIKSEMRPLIHQFGKCAAAGHISDGQADWFDRRLRAVEAVLTAKHPDALGDLGDTPRATVLSIAEDAECDDTYTCECEGCRTHVSNRVEDGVRRTAPLPLKRAA